MKKIKKWKLFLLYPLLGILTLILIIIVYKLDQSTVILTKNGIYKTLQVPVKSKFIEFNANLAGAADGPTFDNDFIEGPIVTYQKDNTISVDWYQNDETHHKTYDSSIKNFTIDTKNQILNFSLPEIKIPVTEITTTPDKVVFISDIHGDYEYMDTLLKNLKVIDSLGNWCFGENYLVIAGDMVDRGTKVSTVLWKTVRLSEQAELAGGMVHYLLGNHEQYILRGNFSRVNPANLFAIQQMMSFKDAFSNKTYLGQWLRTRPILLKIGTTLITHGGISPETAAKKYTIKQINQAIWDYWDNKPIDENLKEIILGKTGVTQYRGYIRQNDKIKKSSKKEVEEILKTYNVSHIIVGHTNVPTIKPLYDETIYDINAIETSPQALVFENGIPKIVNTRIIKEEKAPQVYSRDFSFFKANDLKMVALTIRNIVKLSSISHPY
ncbi:metallophosphoesterase [Aquimarina megaterium]|uniref:metallophosphoesterase n=1 Tax=Aquimarina megaterium TaxID=1443666 RepID=UPI00046F070F|nr:metallophosphoesterase [Aquimarina megaterium]